MIRNLFDNIGSPILISVGIALFILETKYQLRKRVQERWKRILINVGVSLPSFALLRFLFLPLMVWLAFKNQTLEWGLNYFYELPVWLEGLVAFLLLDYGNYLWHFLNHRFPILWRFHLVHHTDLDLDISTAFRFHFGELIGSVFFRGAIILLSGASPALVLVYEIVFEAATQFHHSNWRLALGFENLLNKIIVTPRMHGIHHSVVRGETDSNYSVIFSFWDRIHRTINLDKSQRQVVIGVPSYHNKKELNIAFLLKLPFTAIRPWQKEGASPGNPEEIESNDSRVREK